MAKKITPHFDPEQNAGDILNIVAAIAMDQRLGGVYVDKDGVVSWRIFRPREIRRCQNGSAIVEVYDEQRKDTRKFRLGMLTHVIPMR